MQPEQPLTFGPFRLDARGRSLTEADRPVAIGDRALDLLIALIERRGEILSPADLISRAWGRRHIADGNLRVQVSALRRALRDEGSNPAYVATVRGRGYGFVAKVTPSGAAYIPIARRSLPSGLSEPIGRESDVAAIADRARRSRLLTLVGPGGIGKTTLALACGRFAQAGYADGVVYAEVSTGVDPSQTVATSLGLRFLDQPTVKLSAYLAPLELLIIIDSCEYAIDGAARLADAILREAPRVVVLASSREPLRAEGEAVWRVEPLAVPAEPPPSAAEALTYAAIRLFFERASASDQAFKFPDEHVPTVTNICRRLDGLPLAIELAAGRVAAFGLAGVEIGLDNRFQLLSEGRRTAVPRHRTLAAAVDWSYDSLSVEEQRALCGLSLFQGPFAALDAAQVAFGDGHEPGAASEILAALVAKSLVSADISNVSVEYRLLDTTRDYARLKLEASGELRVMAARHAAWVTGVFTDAHAQYDNRSTQDWRRTFDHRLRDAQSALDWAFSAMGDASVAAPLTLAATPIWMQFARSDECVRRIEAALTIVGPDSHEEMALCTALIHALFDATTDWERMKAACARVVALAGGLGEPAAELRGEFGLFNLQVFGAVPGAREIAIRSRRNATVHGSPIDKIVAGHMVAVSEFLSGNLAAARAAIDLVLPLMSSSWDARARLAWYLYEADISSRITLVSLLWMEGMPESALHAARANLAQVEAMGAGQAMRADVLADSCCSIALCTGDLIETERYLANLDDSRRRGASYSFRAWAQIVRATIAARRGDPSPGLSFLDGELPWECAHPRFALVLTELAMALGEAGGESAARDLADHLLQRVEDTGERWMWSEVQRVRGELEQDEASAVSRFERALSVAQEQGARAWALRAATSLARRRPGAAKEVLAPLLASFTEGADSKDHIAARWILRRTRR